MNVSPCFHPALLAAILATSVCAGPLDAYRGQNRLIVVSLPDAASAGKVAAAIAAHRQEILERDLKIIDASEEARQLPTATRLAPEPTHLLRKQLHLTAGTGQPVFILVGKDGGEKARQHGTLDFEKWFALIDEMPMRRAELQNPRKKSP